MNIKRALHWFPVIQQLGQYSKAKCINDLVVASIVTVMLIPQSLAYAMLAGLPPQYGLYASIVPLMVYSLLGSSTTLSVGPVAIVSIMTASTLSTLLGEGGIYDAVSYLEAAITLALLSGVMLLLLGLLKFGFVTNFLSHSVVSGFITASGFMIALSQIRPLLGIEATGDVFYELASNIISALANVHGVTAIVGLACLVLLVAARRYAEALYCRIGVYPSVAASLAKMSPILVVLMATACVAWLSLDKQGVSILGAIPLGVAEFRWPNANFEVIKALILPAFLIAIIGYVESIAVARTLASKKIK